jgi:SNF2 family DNA or RNA helicase
MEPGQASLYRQQLDLARQHLHGGKTMRILADLTCLRQICCDPQLFLKQTHSLGSGKLLTLLDRLEELLEAGHSVLVFSQFTSMLDIIRAQLQQHDIKHWMITGDTPLNQREQFVREFSEDEEPGIFLLSLKAAGTGLTLTKADYVFIFDPWWNPAVEDQAIDRTHRLGQTKAVTAYRLIAADSIEERMLKLMEQKRELFQAIVNDAAADGAFSRLTQEDLRQLLK